MINQDFRAICEVQTQARDEGNPFDHLFQRPAHLAPPSLTYEISGRIDYLGNEVQPLDREAISKATLLGDLVNLEQRFGTVLERAK